MDRGTQRSPLHVLLVHRPARLCMVRAQTLLEAAHLGRARLRLRFNVEAHGRHAPLHSAAARLLALAQNDLHPGSRRAPLLISLEVMP